MADVPEAVEVGTGLKRISIALIVFGFIDAVGGVVGLSRLAQDEETSDALTLVYGLAFCLGPGILGIAAGAMLNPGGCYADPGPGTAKRIAIMSIINSILHAAAMVFVIYMIVTDNNILSILGASSNVLSSLGAFFVIWYFIGFVTCVLAAVFAWRAPPRSSRSTTRARKGDAALEPAGDNPLVVKKPVTARLMFELQSKAELFYEKVIKKMGQNLGVCIIITGGILFFVRHLRGRETRRAADGRRGVGACALSRPAFLLMGISRRWGPTAGGPPPDLLREGGSLALQPLALLP